MSDTSRRLYAAILRLHPPAFHREFGREMQLDFQEAHPQAGIAFLYLDALRSVALQWAKLLLPAAPEHAPLAKPSLLAGQYVTLSLGGPSISRVAASTLLSAAFYLAIAATLTALHAPANTNPQTGLANSPGHNSAYGHAASTNSQISHQPVTASNTTPSLEDDAPANPLTPTNRMQANVGAHRQRGVAGKAAMPAGPSLPWHLASWIVLANLAWLLACLWIRRTPLARRIALALLAALALAAPAASGLVLREPHQQGIVPAETLAFDVVSIRPWRPPVSAVSIAPPPPADGATTPRASRERFVPIPGPLRSDRLHMILPTRMLIGAAYGIPFGSESRVLGGPDWIDSEQFEISARIDDALFATLHNQSTADQQKQVARMEQSLLADRFHLLCHTQARLGPVYDLVIAKGGPRLSPSKPGETPRLSLVDIGGAFRMTAVAIPLDVWLPSPFMGGRTIVDKTGLKGTWDFQLTWRPAQLAGVDNDQAPDQPPLLEAIQQQLGLKLVESKGPIQTIVIDHIERPSAN